jgi:hypothetical protein
MNNKVAIHKSRNNETVIKFIDLESIPEAIQKMYNNGSIYGLYYNEDNKIVALDIWEEEHSTELE